MSRKTTARAFLLIAGGVLGIVGFVLEARRDRGYSREDLFVLIVSVGIFSAGVVKLLRGRGTK